MQIVTLAIKDLRLMLRDKIGAFFILVFPVLMGVFFGLVMGGTPSSSRGKMKVAVVDHDQSEWSQRLIAELAKNDGLLLETDEWESARNSVRLGQRVGLIAIPRGFGETAAILWEEQPEIQLGFDPSRRTEAAMLEGMLMQASGALIAERLRQPTQLLPRLDELRRGLSESTRQDPVTPILSELLDQVADVIDSADQLQRVEGAAENQGGIQMQFANIKNIDISEHEDPGSVRAQLKKIRSRWDISFPQGMIWGILGCAAGFASSIAREDARGTLVRLRAAPLTKLHILLGKALACLIACCLVIALLTIIGTALGMRSDDYAKLFVSALVVSIAFVGIMMTMSVLGKTEESVNGSGWAINMVMAMLGGGMVPAMFLPQFLQSVSGYSPVFWAIRLIEGAIWRQFGWHEMLLPIAVLLMIGLLGMVLGTLVLMRRYK